MTINKLNRVVLHHLFQYPAAVIGKNIKELRKLAGWSQEELAERVGMTQQQVSAIEAGKTIQPRRPELFARVFGVAESRVRYGISVESEGAEQLPGFQLVALTLLPLEAAGGWPGNAAEYSDTRLVYADYKEDWYVIEVPDDAMVTGDKRSLPPETTLVMAPGEELKPGDIVLAKLPTGEIVLREWRKNGSQPFLRARNPDYPPIHNEGIEPLAKAVIAWNFQDLRL